MTLARRRLSRLLAETALVALNRLSQEPREIPREGMDRAMVVVKVIKTTKRPEGRPFWWMTEADYRRIENASGGFCLACQRRADGVEPDERGYGCDSCGESKVYGVLAMVEIGRLEVVTADDLRIVKGLP